MPCAEAHGRLYTDRKEVEMVQFLCPDCGEPLIEVAPQGGLRQFACPPCGLYFGLVSLKAHMMRTSRYTGEERRKRGLGFPQTIKVKLI